MVANTELCEVTQLVIVCLPLCNPKGAGVTSAVCTMVSLDLAVSPAHHAPSKVSQEKRGGRGWSSQKGQVGRLLATFTQPVASGPCTILMGGRRSLPSLLRKQRTTAGGFPAHTISERAEEGCEGAAQEGDPEEEEGGLQRTSAIEGQPWIRGATASSYPMGP